MIHGAALGLFPSYVHGAGDKMPLFFENFASHEIHGFWEVRAGTRTKEDPHEKDISVAEARFQAEVYSCTDFLELKCIWRYPG